MKTGKVPENVLKRSVLRQIRAKGEEVLVGAGIGNDCAIFPLSGDGVMAGCMQEAVIRLGESVDGRPAVRAAIHTDSGQAVTAGVYADGGQTVEAGAAADGGQAIKAENAADREKTEAVMTIAELIQKCANNLAAGGARPMAVMIALLLPEGEEEALLRELMKVAGEKCRELDLEIAGGQSRVTGAVTLPMAVVTGFGKPFNAGWDAASGNVLPGQDVVLSKWIGLQGTAVLAGRSREKLLGRYPAYLVEEAAGFDRYLSILAEAEIAVKHGVCAMHDASEGGILGALWELAEGADVGLTVDMRKLPLRQETVEVCECCNVNPYELMSGGCLIMTCRDGLGLVTALEEAGIPATVVGKVTDSNNRILINGDEIRYMNRPERDGIYVHAQEHLPNFNV